MTRVLVVIGTRPEAIKLSPVIHALRETGVSEVCVCTTGQHSQMVDGVLQFTGIAPDFALPAIKAGQDLNAILSEIVARIDGVLERAAPEWVIVQGDTTTTIATALAALARRVPIAHVEAGLRSGDLQNPWPEEGYRRAVSGLSALHFAPTESAAAALRAEQIPAAQIHVTGNTVIDALYWTRDKLRDDPSLANAVLPPLDRFAGKRILLVTAHRRESLGAGMENIAAALHTLARRDDVGIIIARHSNPEARRALAPLSANPAVALIEPVNYPEFVHLLDRADLVLTDSGGVQEEAPALGTPVVVMRNVTERPEAVAAGTARLAGTSMHGIVSTVSEILDDPEVYARMAKIHSPYGDGHAAERIARIMRSMA